MLRVASILLRVATRVRREGLRRSARYYVSALKYCLHYLAYDRRSDRYEAKRTSGAADVSESDVIGSMQTQEFWRYHAFPRLPLIWSINILRIDPVDYTFIDYGSGRGRVLLAAARFPFARIIDIEFSCSLREEAQRNIAAYTLELLACRNLASSHMNAVDFRPPPGGFIAFFFNPFPLEIVERVASQLEVAARRSGGASFVIFIFANTKRFHLFKDRPSFRRLTPLVVARARLRVLSTVFVEFAIEPKRDDVEMLMSDREQCLGARARPMPAVSGSAWRPRSEC